jgi:hypothetical protein
VDLLTFLELDAQIADTFSRTLDAQTGLVDSASALLTLTGETDALRLLESF